MKFFTIAMLAASAVAIKITSTVAVQEAPTREQIMDVLNKFDANKDGMMTKKEFCKIANEHLGAEGDDCKNVWKGIKKAAGNSPSHEDIATFVEGAIKAGEEAASFFPEGVPSRKEILKLLAKADPNGDGNVSADEFCAAVKAMGAAGDDCKKVWGVVESMIGANPSHEKIADVVEEIAGRVEKVKEAQK